MAVLVGLITALGLYPHVSDYLLIRALGSENLTRRTVAILRATAEAKRSPRTARRLENALKTDSDVRFGSIVAVLRYLGRFDTPQRDPLQVDRMRAIEIAAPQSAGGDAFVRRTALAQLLLSGRDNRYVRRSLALAKADRLPAVRALAATLAAKLGDDAALGQLLDDDDSAVASAALLAGSIAGRRAAGEKALEKILAGDRDTELVSAAAYALAALDAKRAATVLPGLIGSAGDSLLRDRLLYVASTPAGDGASDAVMAVIRRSQRADGHPPPAAMLAAARLGIAEAGPAARSVLKAAAEGKKPLDESQVLAAIRFASECKLPVRREADGICLRLWGPYWQHMLVAAARLLGEQADMPQPPALKSPSRAECIQRLRQAAMHPAAPVASAAAAAALWRLKAQLAGEFVIDVAGRRSTLPGDYLAWQLAGDRPAGAFELGKLMLPAPNNEAALRQYNDNVRSAGAMLLALSASGDEQADWAAERIHSRLVGGELGGEDDFYVAGAYRCALLILGREDFRQPVRELLGTGEFPQRRVVTAMLAAGDRKALDWLLWNPQLSLEDSEFLLVEKGLADVLAELAADLPPVDVAADRALRLWQVRILRDFYAIRRAEVQPGLRRRK